MPTLLENSKFGFIESVHENYIETDYSYFSIETYIETVLLSNQNMFNLKDKKIITILRSKILLIWINVVRKQHMHV